MRHSLRSLAALSLLTLGACGSGAATDAGGAPESVPYASTSTSAAPAAVPSTTASSAAPVPVSDPAGAADPTAAVPAAGGGEANAAMITSLLSTDDGRAMVAEMMAQETGITQEQAVCFLENVDAETMVSLSELGASGATPDPSALPPGVLDDLMGAVSTCGIAPDTILG